ncbi:deoxyguanosinetriphosphate triphosphohydrolase [Magnetovibrio sp. PR-2]|uniref:deoxyguanosinetriphosphate triphosphohydrolase n=1 Tax=Magnetovibrio sp. PR-2 TaxID=3120356 RepID=UPI002FCE43BA
MNTSLENLATFACIPEQSRGRLHAEPESATRSCYQRDRDRIIHAAAFRRLQYKTQVFVNHEGDFFRTRLTHSLEVSQIARSIAQNLELNQYLAETLALAHDMGHTPFGHAGEFALEDLMEPFGGFDHNAQSLRVVTKLEQRYADFDGLNLTWETLEGVVKHNGPLTGVEGAKPLPWAIVEYAKDHDLELGTYASAEAQIAAVSDDVAYNNHDIDDGLRAGLFTVNDIREVDFVGKTFAEVEKKYPELDFSRTVHEVVRRTIGMMVEDILKESRVRLADAKPKSVEDIRTYGEPLIAFTDEMAKNDRELKAFLFPNMYRHYKLNRMTSKARRVVQDLFALFLAEPGTLPTEWQEGTTGPNDELTARVVADYIAGMTDRHALDEHKRLFDLQARTSDFSLG